MASLSEAVRPNNISLVPPLALIVPPLLSSGKLPYRRPFVLRYLTIAALELGQFILAKVG